MKNIQNYHASKYDNGKYILVEEGIYQLQGNDEASYFTSLSFVQEPEFDEGENAAEIAQYPLEDLLDEFMCSVSDFYQKLNTADSQVCYLEFESADIQDIRGLRTIIGKHVYTREDDDTAELVIE